MCNFCVFQLWKYRMIAWARLIVLASLCLGTTHGQFPPPQSNNNNNNNGNFNPFNQNNNLDNTNQQSTFRERDRDPFGNPFLNNNANNAPLTPPPSISPRDRDRDRERDFNPFDGSFNSFPPQGLPPRQDPFNPFSTRRDFGNPFASPPRFDTSDSSYYSGIENEKECPQGWHLFPPNQSPQQACYKFVLSPTHTRNEAQRNCQVFNDALIIKKSYGFRSWNFGVINFDAIFLGIWKWSWFTKSE